MPGISLYAIHLGGIALLVSHIAVGVYLLYQTASSFFREISMATEYRARESIGVCTPVSTTSHLIGCFTLNLLSLSFDRDLFSILAI